MLRAQQPNKTTANISARGIEIMDAVIKWPDAGEQSSTLVVRNGMVAVMIAEAMSSGDEIQIDGVRHRVKASVDYSPGETAFSIQRSV